jgi:hypothetical protein
MMMMSGCDVMMSEYEGKQGLLLELIPPLNSRPNDIYTYNNYIKI